MSSATELPEEVAQWRPRWLTSLDTNTYTLTRFVFLRFLGLMYAVAFLVAVNQLVPLVGAGGLQPASRFLNAVSEQLGPGEAHVRLPTLFWLGASDTALYVVAYAGLVLRFSFSSGSRDAIVLFLLWLFYLSIIQVGQVFWGYGWESLLLRPDSWRSS